ncbi:rhamnosyltransferase [Nitrosomonas sp. Is79A3]|uniref:rhamnosyltransferase n=1 Tax=Nitrosomonas sp. (strain Is79A3) TaxID=261292 RepID=UPI000215C729
MKKLHTDIVPIVVTFNPDESTLIDNLTSLLSQVQYVVIVDNDSTCDVTEIIQRLDEECFNRINLIKLPHNSGLGKAFNTGIAEARDLNAVFVLLMDQDSIPESNMLSKLHNAYQNLEKQGILVGAVAPRYRDSTSSQLSQFVRISRFRLARIFNDKNTNYLRADFLISSGSLIAMHALEQVGEMDVGLFIDHIDTEWCFRTQSKGFALYGVCDAFMQHSLGDKHIRIWWGRWRNISFHQPFRYYYMFRNSALLWQRPYMPEAWKRADKLRILCMLFFFTLFSPNRIANLHMMLKGLKDGFNRRTGKL